MRSRAILTFVAGALLAANLEAADRWLHMRVIDNDGTRVSMNLPFSIIEKAAPLIPSGVVRRSRIECNGHHVDSAALRNAIRQSVTAGTATYDEDDHRVVVTRADGKVSITAREIDGGDTVRLTLPASIVDSMVSSEVEEIDMSAAIQALAKQGSGDLMFADSDDATVRVWIDETP